MKATKNGQPFLTDVGELRARARALQAPGARGWRWSANSRATGKTAPATHSSAPRECACAKRLGMPASMFPRFLSPMP